jgi:hypothetical protein
MLIVVAGLPGAMWRAGVSPSGPTVDSVDSRAANLRAAREYLRV